MKKMFFAALAALVCFTGSAQAVEIFFSTSGIDPNAGSSLNLTEGGAGGSLFVWVNNDEATTIEGLSLDVTSDTAGVALATDHLIENPGGRWFGSTPGVLGDSPLVNDSNAFNFFGGFPQGLALHSEILIDPLAAGVTNIGFDIGNNGIAVGGQPPQSISFGSGSINVTAVPEPGTIAGLASIGMFGCGLVGRRRRR
ncbi:PEP-CTERM sorting domain-containing protein [Roseiconus lacunae]|uniref:PEP-CTERM sorting domain-containing protein n=1 Tax=Roseiconus lacunae TaxID=2605694 RepID=A0ABT7PEB8_9BACT|nr:PEP-CTERM sorting domain-containing protein [Roseiconus lacunae]MCD0462850.1 PEP-CTERM sorting domain-containing protein [Roseiconus lacunae]MDM4014842.1 PEP-CTERM sorting domain-containing protein [Roseiconus lacunae]